jgi:succinate dehydrogenase cytochrome b subunit
MAQAQNATPSRPISPHLQIWRWHVTMLASILHRVTGAALSVGVLGIVIWLAALAGGPEVFAPVDQVLHSLLGRIVLYALVAALGFHLFAGLRHLVLDAGVGFERGMANLSAWICLAGLVIVPAGLWAVLHAMAG